MDRAGKWIESAALDGIWDTDLVLRLCGRAGGATARLRYSVLLQFSEKNDTRVFG